MNDTIRVKRGQVFLYQNFNADSGSIIRKERPWLVISNDIGNSTSTCCNIIPITTRDEVRGSYQVHYISEGGRSQVIQTEQIYTVNQSELKRYLYTLSDSVMDKVEKFLVIQFGIKQENLPNSINGFLSKIENGIVDIVKRKAEEYKTIKECDIDDVVLRIGTTIESLFPTKERSENQATIDTKREEPSQVSVSRTPKPIKQESQIEKFNRKYGYTSSSSTTESSLSKEKRPYRRWTVDVCKEFLKDCDELSLTDVMKKYGLSNKQSVYSKKYTCRRTIEQIDS